VLTTGPRRRSKYSANYQSPDAIGRTRATFGTRLKERAERHAHDLGSLALHLARCLVEDLFQVSGNANPHLSLHRDLRSALQCSARRNPRAGLVGDGGRPGHDVRVKQHLTVRARNEPAAAANPSDPLHRVAACGLGSAGVDSTELPRVNGDAGACVGAP
jgi:hypothetical protein